MFISDTCETTESAAALVVVYSQVTLLARARSGAARNNGRRRSPPAGRLIGHCSRAAAACLYDAALHLPAILSPSAGLLRCCNYLGITLIRDVVERAVLSLL